MCVEWTPSLAVFDVCRTGMAINAWKSKLPHLFFLFLVYIFVGVSYFHGVDQLSVLDSIYFSVVTFATVG
jgi:hypothetical protein